jgi:hypothetical protein
MAHHSIEETFQAIRPRGRKGVPNAPTIVAGVIGGSGDLASSLSQAGQQIAQLQAAYQQNAALITANTQAIQSNTSSQGGHSVAGTVGQAASSIFGGGLGLLSPIISGIAGLFGGHAAPAPLPVYTAPAPVSLNATLNSATPGPTVGGGSGGQNPNTGTNGSQPTSTTPNVTVNISAMDSQSFMDRSSDIASAVRQAMLNLHPINTVIAEL